MGLSRTQVDKLGDRLRKADVPEIAHKADPNIEVVLLEADSRETLLRTHARYFKTVAEIARGM